MNSTIPKSPMKLLVVEDSRTQAEYLRHILENEGYRVVLAVNGLEALEQIKIDRPALVLSDIIMPEMDGYELCKRIRSDASIAKIPVILVTQLFDPVDVIKGLEAGADNFIIKPFEPQHVYSRIQSVIQMIARSDPDDRSGTGIEVLFANSNHTITASRLQILTILLSTYDLAVKKNTELSETHERLNSVNEELQVTVKKVKLANDDLINENIERRKVEAALEKANKKLQLMASITRHDLLNQLTALHEFIELALMTKTADPDNAWNHIITAEGIVNQTVNTVRFTEDYQKVGIKSAVWQRLRTQIDNYLKHTSLGTVKIDNSIPADIEVYADPLIEKVFSNLIENAMRYGGKSMTTIRFTYACKDDTCTIICEDDGSGVSADEKEKIFSYGFGKNTGLGLFLSREILNITGITIKETGELHKGARFEITCPHTTIRNSGLS
ncbi:MAG: hybrid sensor histidine kinase/response regulator [Methanoregula sp.]|nr:hybrid sensor histidine kinase/response regulator [Methanoregula sp.]